MPTAIIAHRTCPLHAPENSIAGIQAAASLGADGVEVDVRLAADGVPVLMHDRSPMRTTGLPGALSLYPSSILLQARLQGTDERVPTLSQALEALPRELLIAIEVKTAAAVVSSLELVREHGLEQRTLLWSYRESAVRYTAERSPHIEASLLRDDTDDAAARAFLAEAQQLGARGVSAHWDVITGDFIKAAEARGIRVYSMNRGLDLVLEKARSGLAGIVTDYPLEVRQILAGRGEPAIA